jgi:hypothetical protein
MGRGIPEGQMEDHQLPKRSRRHLQQVQTQFEPSYLAPQVLAQVYGCLVPLPSRRRQRCPPPAAVGAAPERRERRREGQQCS